VESDAAVPLDAGRACRLSGRADDRAFTLDFAGR